MVSIVPVLDVDGGSAPSDGRGLCSLQRTTRTTQAHVVLNDGQPRRGEKSEINPNLSNKRRMDV